MFRLRGAVLPTVIAASALTLAGCGATGGSGGEGIEGIEVLASIYPLAYVAAQVGGDLVTVSIATPAGTDPHAIELSPRQLRDVGEADLVVYLRDFQAAFDEAVDERAPEHALDVATVADLLPLPQGAADEHGDAHADEAEDEDAHGGLDPHFWLDPERLAAAARAIADDLAHIDPDHAQTYRANAGVLANTLATLDDEYADGLGTCESDVVVTSHAAFGYLTERYGLRQVSVSGIDPEGEPSPARIREVRETIADLGVTAVFTEPLADPAVAATLAEDLGVEVLQLDPLDSHAQDAPDYRDVMAANLDALRTGLGCS